METSAADKWLTVGRIGAVHGIKGMVRVQSETEPPEKIFEYLPWQLRQGKREVGAKVVDWQASGKRLIARLEGISSPEAAQAWVGAFIQVPQAQLPALPADEFYWHQLEGMQVFAMDGRLFGRVHHLIETGANDVLVVQSCEGSLDQRERLIPWTPGVHVQEVNLQDRRIKVDWDPEF